MCIRDRSKGGYPIDFVMEFYGKSFPEAVQMLTGENGEGQTEACLLYTSDTNIKPFLRKLGVA